MSKDYTKELNALATDIGEVLIMVVDESKIQTAANLMNKYGREFHEKVKDIDSNEVLAVEFDHYINSCMSVCETLGISSLQWKPARKIILGNFYKFRKDILKLEPKKIMINTISS